MNESTDASPPPLISVVVPIFNEAENLPELRRRLVAALDQTAQSWEIICVDDGSRDTSPQLLRQYHAEEPRLKAVFFSRNFGHQPAVTAGIHLAGGQCVILMDGDLQDPPEVIPQLVAKWRQGFQVVLAERSDRTEKGARGIGFKLFYPLLRKLSGLPTPNAGIFGLMDRVVVQQFNLLPERNRFIPGLRIWLGFKQTTVEYSRQSRAAGEAKQTFGRLVKYAMDAMISFSYKPLRAATWVGMIVSGGAFLLAIFYLIDFLRHREKYGSGFTTLILCMLFLGGVQLITIGILGEYVGRIYEEIKQRPLYVVSEMLGMGQKNLTPRRTDAEQ